MVMRNYGDILSSIGVTKSLKRTRIGIRLPGNLEYLVPFIVIFKAGLVYRFFEWSQPQAILKTFNVGTSYSTAGLAVTLSIVAVLLVGALIKGRKAFRYDRVFAEF